MRIACTCFLMLCMLGSFIRPVQQTGALTGAWQRRSGAQTEVLLFTDGYCSFTTYNMRDRKFSYTLGGPVLITGDSCRVLQEFNTQYPEQTGQYLTVRFALNKDKLVLYNNGSAEHWERVDEGRGALAGAWHISKRMQDGQLQAIHQTGTRKTIKLLTGTRFQWVAIDPGSKGFYGTGGGTYIYKDSAYTEKIEFFSRDSNRVGAQLTFTGKVIGKEWYHSGKRSDGVALYEVWSRSKE